MIRFARCAVLAVAASCVLSERVDVPLVTVEAAHPVTFELPAPASKTVLGSVHVTNTLSPSQSGCDSDRVWVGFEFGTYSTQFVQIGYGPNHKQEVVIGLNTSTIQVTVSTRACKVALQVYAHFYELTDRAFTTQTQLTVVAKGDFPSTDYVQVSLGAGQAAFTTHISMAPVALAGCTNGPPVVGLIADTYTAHMQEAFVEQGGPPMVVTPNIMHVGQLGLSVIFLNITGASCKLTAALQVQGFEVQLDATPAPATRAPRTPHPRAIYTPQPTQYMPTPYPPLPTSSDDDTLLIVMLTVFVGGTVVGLVVLAAACWWCRKNRTSFQQESAHETSPDQGAQGPKALPGSDSA